MTTTKTAETRILSRIASALDAAAEAIAPFQSGGVTVRYKSGRDPVTEADHAANLVLRAMLVQEGEGWLSEETTDDFDRLQKSTVWVVDPIDGTREFVQGIPEWCISIALVQDGAALAGGIHNPLTRETILGSRNTGVTYNGTPAALTKRKLLPEAVVLASRSEVTRGEWKCFDGAPFKVRSVGSVAYKLALVAAGKADATWTLVPKHEWDIAAGTSLMEAAGGIVRTLDGKLVRFNNRKPKLPDLMACNPELYPQVHSMLAAERVKGLPTG